MFLTSLDIKEFRGIKSCEKPLRLNHFNVLIGRNNSGKSSILEALSLLPAPNIENYITKKSKINSLLELHKSKKEGYKPLLYLYAANSIIQYNLAPQFKNIRIELNEKEYNTFLDGQRAPDATTISKFLNRKIEELDNLVFFIPDDISIIEDLERRMAYLKESIVKSGIHIKIAEDISNCVDDKYSEIIFSDPIIMRKIFSDKVAYIDITDLGSGAEKTVKIMSLIEVKKPEILLIDDFEAGLHPTLINLFLKWLKNKKFQTIISTHSIDVLYALVELNLNPKFTSIIQLYKSSEDILSHKVLTLDDLEDLIDTNSDPRLLVDTLRF